MNELLRSNVKSHARRYLATGLAVAISMAFVVVALAFSAGMNASLTKSVRDHYAGTAAVVALNFDEVDDDARDPRLLSDYIPELAALPEVAAVGQEGYNYWELRTDKARISTSINAVNPPQFSQPEVLSGKLPATATELVLSASQAQELGVDAGDTLAARDLWTEDDAQQFTVSGIIADTGSGGGMFSTNAYATAEALAANDPYGLLVALSDSEPSAAAQQALADKISARFGDAVDVQTTDSLIAETLEQMQMSQGTMTAIMLVFPVIALVVAAIVVSTTFQIVLHQRRRELALLRTLGASAKQVRRLVLQETAIVGAAASLVGVLTGVLASAIGLLIMDIADSFGEALAMQKPVQLVLVWLAGALMTLAAGARPALGVTRIPPIAALAPVDQSGVAARRSHRVRLIAGLIIAGLAGAGLFYGIKAASDAGFLIAFFSGVVCLIGALLVVSVVLPQLTYALGKPGRGVVAQMARSNTLRNPDRTASTGTAIVIGVTLIATMAVAAGSLRETLNAEVDSRRPFDLTVTSRNVALAPETLERVGAVEGVDAVVAVHGVEALPAADGSLALQAPDSLTKPGAGVGDRGGAGDGTGADPSTMTNPVTVYGQPDLNAVAHSEVPVLADDAVEMNEATPEMWGLAVSNGFLRVCATTGECADLKVTLVDNIDYSSVLISASTLDKLVPDTELRQINLRLSDVEEATSVQNAITSLADDLDVGGAAAERAMYTSMINMVLLVIVGLLAVSVLVALVGVTNTLSLSVIERTRENGLLRALGLSRRQMQHMLALEAIYVALTSAIVGVVLGVFFGWAGTLALPLDLERTIIVIPWLQILGVMAVAILSAIVASWLPGRRAARTSPVEALATE
ncbi:MAG: FtsX-like permease family protein [Ancrocorticia sp.]